MTQAGPGIEAAVSRGDRSVDRRGRILRRAIVVAICLVVAVALWIWVFPWVDKTYVNRPQIGL